MSKETGLLKSWSKSGPPLLWTFDNAGIGYSGPALVGHRLFLMGARGDSEYVFALDLDPKREGKPAEVWAVKIGPTFTFKGNTWGPGPRATPTVEGDLVFALGGQGTLVSVSAASGKEVWRRDLAVDMAAEVNPIGGGPEKLGWGFCWSPLVDGDQLICVPGGPAGTVAALDKKTGKILWRSKELTDQASYSSPIVASVGGIRHYVILTNEGVAGVAAKAGQLLWKYAKKPPYNDVVIPTPIFHEEHVYVTVGWGAGCDLIKLTRAGEKIKADKVYANKNMVNHQGGVVLVGDHLFGYSENKGWIFQDFKSGQTTWSEKRALGRGGSVIYADGRLYCYTEDDGVLVQGEATPAGFKITGRYEIPQQSKQRAQSGKVWTHPVIADGKLYLRDQELLFCLDIKDPSGR